MKKDIKDQLRFTMLKITFLLVFVILASFLKMKPINARLSYEYMTTFFVSFGPILAFLFVLISCVLINKSQGITKIKIFDLVISVLAYFFVLLSALFTTMFS